MLDFLKFSIFQRFNPTRYLPPMTQQIILENQPYLSTCSGFLHRATCYRELQVFVNFRCRDERSRSFRVPSSPPTSFTCTPSSGIYPTLWASRWERNNFIPSQGRGLCLHYQLALCSSRKMCRLGTFFSPDIPCRYDVLCHRVYFLTNLTYIRINRKIDIQEFMNSQYYKSKKCTIPCLFVCFLDSSFCNLLKFRMSKQAGN